MLPIKKTLFFAVAFFLFCSTLVFSGYRFGFRQAETAGQNRLLLLQKEYAENAALVEHALRKKFERQIAKNVRLERQVLQKKTELEAEQKITRKRIENANRTLDDYSFPVEWVQLYNEAIGAKTDNCTAFAATGDIDGKSRAAKTACAGILPKRAVSARDLLAHIRDYGLRNRKMEAQLNALIRWTEENYD